MNYLHYKNTVLELCLVTVFLKTKKILTTTVQCSVATSVTCGSMMSALDVLTNLSLFSKIPGLTCGEYRATWLHFVTRFSRLA